jgi:hypothetical protein
MTTNETPTHRMFSDLHEPQEQPDALTRLERHMPMRPLPGDEDGADEGWGDAVAILISEARKEMEALRKELDGARALNDGLRVECRRHAEAATSLSNKSSEALRMGQQQGRVELAQEILEADMDGKREHLPMWARAALGYEVKE